MECCSAGENSLRPEGRELPSNQSTPDSVDQTTGNEQASTASTSESGYEFDDKEQPSTVSTDGKDQPSAQFIDGKEQLSSELTDGKEERSTESTSESVDQTDGKEQLSSESPDGKEQLSTVSTSKSVDQTGGKEQLSSESTDGKEQLSTVSTSESVDQTDDCANLSTDIKSIVLLQEQSHRPDTKDVNETSEDKGSCSCDIKSADDTETSSSICPSKDDSGNSAEHESETTGELLTPPKSEIEENEGITLVDLPTEVILQLCSLLDSRFLISVLRLVCRRFYSILSDDFIWRSRIMRTWTQLYPAVPTSDEDIIDWRDACLHLEDQRNLWSKKDELMHHTTWKNTHYSCVDSVILVNGGTVCVSGSRDHTLAVWNVESFDEKPLAHVEGHKAWIWRLAVDSQSSFYSCSFDNTLKLWTLEGDLRSTNMYDCKSPVMSIASAPNFAAAALQNNQVCFFDPRAFDAPISTYKLVKGFGLVVGILCENNTPDLVVTGDQTGCVSVWDIRAGKMLKDIPKVKSKLKPSLQTPLSMSLRKDSCYIGDSRGQLHLMDPRRSSETAFEIVATYEPGHSRLKINAVSHGKGHLFSGGQDKLLNMFSPTHEPEMITAIPLKAEITSMDYQNNILVVGCENAVEAFKPITPL